MSSGAVASEGGGSGVRQPGLRVLCGALVVLGAGLRCFQYLAGASQWIDELALSRSVLGLSWGTLLSSPLPFAQIAPKGFVLLEKSAGVLFGGNDYALRLLPLAASLVALELFRRVALRLLVRPAAVAFALALFALQPALVLYAAQVKPYSGDLTITLALTLLALDPASVHPTVRRGLFLGGAGLLAVFLSNAAVLVLAGLGAALVIRARRVERGLAVALGLWTASAVVVVWVRHETTTLLSRYLQSYWASALAPRPHTLAGDAGWLGRSLVGVMGEAGSGLGYPWPALYVALAVAGSVALWRRLGSDSLLLLAPIAVTLAAAELRLYPFSGRVVLFLVPALLLAVAAGAEALAGYLWRRGLAAAGWLLLGALAAPALLALAVDPPVYRIEETKPLLAAVAQRLEPGDAAYAYYGIGQALRFYGPAYGLTPDRYLLGGCHRGDTRQYLREVDRFRGRRRLWLLVAHAQPRFSEDTALLAYLDRLGVRRAELHVPPHGRGFGWPAAAYLYDLSDTGGREAVSADSFPLPVAPPHVDRTLACVGPQNSVSPRLPP